MSAIKALVERGRALGFNTVMPHPDALTEAAEFMRCVCGYGDIDDLRRAAGAIESTLAVILTKTRQLGMEEAAKVCKQQAQFHTADFRSQREKDERVILAAKIQEAEDIEEAIRALIPTEPS